ncbi:hypothetical protein MALGJ_20960 [Mycolicibacter algericus]|uniref:Uncharacterized protein n=1 Tax=Mycolicibacter algericus TaxID=1288388 RepID=A0A7I9Y9X1_MYCAL|nr:hypothetical protein MALGJ_20960 [Mycolicibacter algericus]
MADQNLPALLDRGALDSDRHHDQRRRDGTIELTSGALLWMPKRSRRQFVAGPDGLRYLTIHLKRQFLNLMAAG